MSDAQAVAVHFEDVDVMGQSVEQRAVKLRSRRRWSSLLGITVAELLGIKSDAEPRRRKRAARAKYRDPENAENTWIGKGKPPKWLQEKLDQGASKDEFLIQ